LKGFLRLSDNLVTKMEAKRAAHTRTRIRKWVVVTRGGMRALIHVTWSGYISSSKPNEMEDERAAHTRILDDLCGDQQAVANLRAALTGKPALLDDLKRLERLAVGGKGRDVNAVGPRGTTPLLMACTGGVLEDVRLLLDAGADVKLEGKECEEADDDEELVQASPLTAAARKGHADVVGLWLAQEGVDANQGTTDDGRTALWSACYEGHKEVVELLLACDGVDVNKAKTANGATPLFMACEEGHTEVVGLLLACDGIDVNKAKTTDGATPLFIACQEGRNEVVGLLLACDGIDVNKAKTTDGVTPLFMACQNGHTEVVGLLLACDGVEVNKATTDTGTTPLFMACQKGHTEVVGLMLACDGVEVNKARTDTGATPLYMACQNGHPEVVELLLVCDAIAANKACTNNGATPLHAAADSGHMPIAQLLVVFGADAAALATFEGEHETPQKWATDDGHHELAAWLGAVAGWSQLRVAAGCRLHTPITTMLKLGRMDPDAQPWSQLALARATSTTPPTELPWQDAPDVCQITVKLIKAATRGWAPPRHWLYHPGFRIAVRTVLHVDVRLHRQHSSVVSAADSVATAFLPILPPEMWIAILGFLLRSNWAVL
jgi:ankyrin repeat protein